MTTRRGFLHLGIAAAIWKAIKAVFSESPVEKPGAEESVGCDKWAEWVLYGSDIYMDTFSCTEHLSTMVADDTKNIVAYNDDGVKCCFISVVPEEKMACTGFVDYPDMISFRPYGGAYLYRTAKDDLWRLASQKRVFWRTLVNGNVVTEHATLWYSRELQEDMSGVLVPVEKPETVPFEQEVIREVEKYGTIWLYEGADGIIWIYRDKQEDLPVRKPLLGDWEYFRYNEEDLAKLIADVGEPRVNYPCRGWPLDKPRRIDYPCRGSDREWLGSSSDSPVW